MGIIKGVIPSIAPPLHPLHCNGFNGDFFFGITHIFFLHFYYFFNDLPHSLYFSHTDYRLHSLCFSSHVQHNTWRLCQRCFGSLLLENPPVPISLSVSLKKFSSLTRYDRSILVKGKIIIITNKLPTCFYCN